MRKPLWAPDRPVVLDLFCGAGGAGMGYWRAGFNVFGVDIVMQPDYPFRFADHDALQVLASIVENGAYLFDGTPIAAAHTSPPCQASCALIKGNQRATASNHIDLIPQTRELLEQTGLPSVIENVQGAKIRRDLTLCGEMFGLDVIRHRYFECSFPVLQPEHIKHRGGVRGWRHGQYFDGPYVAVYGSGGGKATVPEAQAAMGIDWTDNLVSINEAIPPAYTEYVGSQLMATLAADDESAA